MHFISHTIRTWIENPASIRSSRIVCLCGVPFTHSRHTVYTVSKWTQWKIIIIIMEWAKKGISNIAHILKYETVTAARCREWFPLWTFNLFRSLSFFSFLLLHHSFCLRLRRSSWYYMDLFSLGSSTRSLSCAVVFVRAQYFRRCNSVYTQHKH